MAKIIAGELEVCSDCAQIIANGEINDGTDTGERTADAQVAKWGDDARGLVLADHEGFEPYFSWSDCDGCGSTLGGDRWPAAVLGND